MIKFWSAAYRQSVEWDMDSGVSVRVEGLRRGTGKAALRRLAQFRGRSSHAFSLWNRVPAATSDLGEEWDPPPGCEAKR